MQDRLSKLNIQEKVDIVDWRFIDSVGILN